MLQRKQYRFLINYLIFFIIPFSCGISIREIDEAPTMVSENDIDMDFFPSQEEIDECRKDSRKCKDFSNYPHELVEKFINEGHIKKEWFSNKMEQKYDDDYSVNSFQGNDEYANYTDLCEGKSVELCSKGGITENGEFVYIVQSKLDNEYRQCFNTVICIAPNNESNDFIPCEAKGKDISGLVGKKYKLHCVVKKGIDYNEVLLGINKDKKLVPVSITRECGCVCEYEKVEKSKSHHRSDDAV